MSNKHDESRERIEVKYRIGLALLFLVGWAVLATALAASPELSGRQGVILGGLVLGGALGAFWGTMWGVDKVAGALADWHLARKRRQKVK